MTKTSELRIGNWVDQPNEGVTKVTSILNDLQIKTETGYVDKYCRPIPLTEEWLLKFGFRKLNNNLYRLDYKSETFELTFYNKGWNFGKYYIDTTVYFSHDKEHVHQLQNLYFALTGEELELT